MPFRTIFIIRCSCDLKIRSSHAGLSVGWPVNMITHILTWTQYMHKRTIVQSLSEKFRGHDSSGGQHPVDFRHLCG